MASKKPPEKLEGATSGTPKKEVVRIKAPNFHTVRIKIVGTSPYVQNRMSAKVQRQIEESQEAGKTSASKRGRTKKDFTKLFHEAMYRTRRGERGIPCSAFRGAMVAACALVDLFKSHAKLAIFVMADVQDEGNGTQLVKITKGKPYMVKHPVRNSTGVLDIRSRPMWDTGWRATLTIEFDADILTKSDVVNLLSRAGRQVGVGEGRAGSKKSETGMGWGFWKVI